jgi:hypothetical protein
MKKFKIGDRVRITGNKIQHGISIGDVKIIERIDNNYIIEGWHVREESLELVNVKVELDYPIY